MLPILKSILAVLGGDVAAWIAPRWPIRHALALAGFVFVMSILSARTLGGRQPRWYQVLLAVLMPLAVIFGGYMRRA